MYIYLYLKVQRAWKKRIVLLTVERIYSGQVTRMSFTHKYWYRTKQTVCVCVRTQKSEKTDRTKDQQKNRQRQTHRKCVMAIPLPEGQSAPPSRPLQCPRRSGPSRRGQWEGWSPLQHLRPRSANHTKLHSLLTSDQTYKLPPIQRLLTTMKKLVLSIISTVYTDQL